MGNPEIWRRIPSLPTVLASNRGRVMIAPYIEEMPNGGVRHRCGRARRGVWAETRYLLVYRGKSYKVARLVCEAFHGAPPFDGAVCMHLDENSRNNAPTNLKWGTQKENLNAPGFIEYCKSRTGDENPFLKGRKKKAA
jgi:hypothetical protein